MSEPLENPVLTGDAEAELLLNAAHEEDHKPFVEDGEEPVVVQTELEESTPTAEELADPANKDRERDPITGKFVKRTEAAAPDAISATVDAPKTAPDAPVLSEYEQKKADKAKAEEIRKDRSWENINKTKDELAQRKRELDQQAQQMRNPQQQRQAPQRREFSSAQFYDAREDFRNTAKAAFKRYQETGDERALDEFNKNDQWADAAEKSAIQFYDLEQREAQQAQLHQHQSIWVQNMEKSIKAKPELGKPDAPISKEIQEILKSHGQVLQMLPDGFDRAVELAQLRLDAKDAPSLREKVGTLQKEVERLTGLTSLSRGGPTGGPAGKKAFDNLSLEDMGAQLRQMAEEADGN